jgi:hypothetical protein
MDSNKDKIVLITGGNSGSRVTVPRLQLARCVEQGEALVARSRRWVARACSPERMFPNRPMSKRWPQRLSIVSADWIARSTMPGRRLGHGASGRYRRR